MCSTVPWTACGSAVRTWEVSALAEDDGKMVIGEASLKRLKVPHHCELCGDPANMGWYLPCVSGTDVSLGV
jgi:hypothetical protein